MPRISRRTPLRLPVLSLQVGKQLPCLSDCAHAHASHCACVGSADQIFLIDTCTPYGVFAMHPFICGWQSQGAASTDKVHSDELT